MDTKHIVEPSRGGRRKGAGRPKGTGKYGEATVPVRIPVSLKPEFDVWIIQSTREKLMNRQWDKINVAVSKIVEDSVYKAIEKLEDKNNG